MPCIPVVSLLTSTLECCHSFYVGTERESFPRRLPCYSALMRPYYHLALKQILDRIFNHVQQAAASDRHSN